MLRKIASILALLLCAPGIASAQEFDNFRFVGEGLPAGEGFVTGISLSTNSATHATLSYLNVAGLSTVYTIEFKPSEAIRDEVGAYQTTGNNEASITTPDPTAVKFLTGHLVDPQGAAVPAHWFRMTLFNGRWSGAFRVADRVYTIDRHQHNHIVDVRHTPSPNKLFQPSKRVKVSVVVDDHYSSDDDKGAAPGYLYALESIHIMDGLLSDSLDLTVLLDQLILQPAALIDSITTNNSINSAREWLTINSPKFDLQDNYSTFFFRSPNNQPANGNNHTGFADQGIVILQPSSQYQFAAAHFFGKLLGLPDEPKTIQQWISSDDVVPAAHWTQAQKDYLDSNLPPARLTQYLSYDEPTRPAVALENSTAPDDDLVTAELPELTNPNAQLSNDPVSDPGTDNQKTTSETGAGSYSAEFSLFGLMVLILMRPSIRRKI